MAAAGLRGGGRNASELCGALLVWAGVAWWAWSKPRPTVEEITGSRDELIYGLFSGTPLSDQHIEDSGNLPSVIEIYKGPLVEDFPDLDELVAEIEITLVHEIAHFMGLDEEAVRAYGYD